MCGECKEGPLKRVIRLNGEKKVVEISSYLGHVCPAGVGDGVEVLGHASQLRFTGHFREVWVGVLK